MLQKIMIFILFLGPLVFFHELGHFLFARLFGVRVEVFSIGFGPKILKFKKGFTEYAVSLIPLGGYVKMFGDDPMAKDGIAPEDRKRSFVFKSKWARFWIVFGGPLANFILAFFIFFTLFTVGEKVPEIKIGPVANETSFYKMGLRSGDVLRQVNGRVIGSPSDIILESGGTIKTLTVNRLGNDKLLELNAKSDDFFESMSNYPPILIQPILKSHTGEYFALSTHEGKVNWNISLEEMKMLEGSRDYFLHKVVAPTQRTEPPKVDSSVRSKPITIGNSENLYKELRSNNLYPIDLVVRSVGMNSGADSAKVKAGDIVSEIQGQEVYNFESLRKLVQSVEGDIKIKFIRNGEVLLKTITPKIKTISGKEVKLIGVESGGVYIKGQYVNTEPLPFLEAAVRSLKRTYETIAKTLEGFKKLIFAETSLKNIGGPIAIGKVASDSFNTSLSYFFQLMALISVNLGVINLFPIPVLDGGHIMFLFFEVLNGGPLSRRKLEIAQQFGLSLLLLLMVGALFNDFTRFF